MIDERVALNLDNMRRAAIDAISFVDDLTELDFVNDTKLQMACAMSLIIIGEATARIEKRAPDFVATHPSWPWDEIRGLRNRIAHDYFSLDVATIWRTVRESLPKLLDSINEVGELDPRLWPKAPPQIGS